MSIQIDRHADGPDVCWLCTSPLQKQYHEIVYWCRMTLGPMGGRWKETLGCFTFTTEADQTLFLLRWS